MQKKVLQDIRTPNSGDTKDRPNRKWDYGGGNSLTKMSSEDGDGNENANLSNIPNIPNNIGAATPGASKQRFSAKLLLLVGLIATAFFVIFVWSFFSTATVRVVLSQQMTTLDDTLSAVRTISNGNGVTYQIVKLEKKATADVKPTGEENVVRKSSGEIVVYSEYGDNMWFVVNTRFQAPDGKIYRIDKRINIPGAKKDSDGNLIPGSIEITVYADEAGEEYNKGLVDFTVPGLLDSDLYDKFYARSKTEMTGGFKGVLKYASEEDVEIVSQRLKEEVREKLLSDSEFVGDDRVLYDDAVFVDFSTYIPTDVSENGMLTIEETGLLRAFVFDKKELSSAIAKKTLSSYDGSVVVVRNIEDMDFVFENKDDFDVNVSDSFDFKLIGSPHIVWEIDTVEFKNDLAGIPKGDVSSIIQNHSSVRKVDADIKPFWKGSFPDNPEAITIEETLE